MGGKVAKEGATRMVEITCLGCGKSFRVPAFIDTVNFDGQLACPECASLLYIRLVGSKVRKYGLLDRKTLKAAAADTKPVPSGPPPNVDVEETARYNPFRDFLASYRASQIHVAFEQIEGLIGTKLDTAAYTFKAWWENDPGHPQALSWLEAGWEVDEVALDQRRITFRRPTRPC
jgi:DNA-directed RNA polymerase subunit RPC12/RpoP